MTTTTSHVSPLGIRSLDPDSPTTACWACGCEMPGPADREYHVIARVSRDALGSRITDVAGGRAWFGECARCAGIVASAERIVEEFPGLRRLGSRKIIAERFAHALIALAALGTQPADWSESAVRSALTRLESVGASLTWRARYSPVRAADARDDECASDNQWTFVSADIVAEARRARAEWLVDGMPPRAQAHPDGSGCLVCGVAAVLARRETEAWFEVSGKHHGHLCRNCHVYTERDGLLVGQALLEKAVFDLIDPGRVLRRKRPDDPVLRRSPLWTDTRRKPSAERFAHLDLESVRRSLETGSWMD